MSDPTAVPELDALGADLASIETAAAPAAAAPGAPGAPGAPAPVDYRAECELLVTFAFDTLAPWYPKTCAAWSPEKRAALIAAAVPVASKYGLTLGALFDRWGPEIGLALVVVPMIGPTMAGLRADRVTAAEQAPQPAGIPTEPKPAVPVAPVPTPPPPAATAAPMPAPTFVIE